MKVKTKDPDTGEIVETEIANPSPVGSIMYKEFEKDIRWLQVHEKAIKQDKFGNYIIYKTSGVQRLVIILLILIFLALLAK